MAIKGSGVQGQYLSCPLAVSTTNAMTLSLWMRSSTLSTPGNVGLQNVLLYLERTTDNNDVGMGVFNSNTLYCDLGGGANINTPSSALPLNRWNHIVATLRAAGTANGEFWINGNKVSNSISGTQAPQTITALRILGHVTQTQNFGAPSTLAVAEPAIWPDAALSAAEIGALSRGANPLTIRPGQLAHYFPLRGANDLADLGYRRVGVAPMGAWTPGAVDHPLVALPPRRRLFFGAAVVTGRTRRPIVTMAG